MTPGDTDFVGSMPELYERYLCPLLFQPYALDIAARARAAAPRRVLEIAAGTGVVTRDLAEVLPDAQIEATDLNEAMVAAGDAIGTKPNVRWSVADAAALPFEASHFDLVVCQFGVMFFPDRSAAFREARRVLSPGGTFIFNVWDGLERNDVARIVSGATREVFPHDPPSFLERTPYGYGNPDPIVRDLRDAGFVSVIWDAVAKRSLSPSARDAATGLCAATPLRHEILARNPEGLEHVIDGAAQALREHFGTGTIDGGMQAYVFTAH